MAGFLIHTQTPPEVAEYPYGPAAPVLDIQPAPDVVDVTEPRMWFGLLFVPMFLLADFSLVPLMHHIGPATSDWRFPLMLICFALIGTQAAVLSAWLVWGEGPFLWRLLIHWGLAAVSCWVWIAGLATCARGTDLIDGHCIAALSMAIVSAAVQAPLWIVRQMFAWRLVRDGSAAAAARETPSTIGNLMLATTVAAVAAAFARLVPADVPQSEFAAAWSVVVGMTAGISTLAILPLAAALLWVRSIGWGLMLSAIYTSLAVAAFWAMAVAVNVINLQTVPVDDLALTTFLIVCFAGLLTLAALAARGMGYRLVIGNRSP